MLSRYAGCFPESMPSLGGFRRLGDRDEDLRGIN